MKIMFQLPGRDKKNRCPHINIHYLFIAIISACLMFQDVKAQSSEASLTLHLDKQGVRVSPTLFGLMTEEINHSYDGGIYAELISNRVFKDNPKTPVHWSLVQNNGKADIRLDDNNPVNDALPVCLRLDVAAPGERAGIANDGYWGIPVKPKVTYKASFYAKTTDSAKGNFTVSIESSDGSVTYASAQVSGVNNQWQRYTAKLITGGDVQPTADARFVISTKHAGTYWFNLVSLFPPTYHNRPNGNRSDIMELLADMKPAFLRLPGGNYLEGDSFSTRFAWKKTIGPLEIRPGHQGCWGYRSSDGMGLLEYLEWCEDLKMQPVLAVFAGYVLKRDYIEAGPLLKPFVDEALDEIEYATGGVNTKWGRRRAKDGHPAPFKIKYIEVGNEDGFDLSGSYDGRFAQFYDAIKAKCPQLQIISTVGGEDPIGKRFKLKLRRPDVYDEHYYRSAWQMEEDAAHYDNYPRNGPKIFVGEWATREGSPTTNFNAALGDAAWMTGLERNADVVIMASYAPLFVNVNPGGMEWKSDLIGYNALNSYGSPSYYAQKMFNIYKGDEVVPVTSSGIPLQVEKLTAKDSLSGVKAKAIPGMFYVATRDRKTGVIYLNVVNTLDAPQVIKIDLRGASKIASDGQEIVLKANNRQDTNSISEPEKIIPVVAKATGLSKSFKHTFPALSITVLQFETK